MRLSEAGIDRVAPKVDEDVQIMRDEIKRDDNRRDGGPGSRRDSATTGTGGIEEEEDDDEENDADGDEPVDTKIAGR